MLDRLGVTGRTKTILQGESLVNDATGLTVYRLALAAVGGSAGSVADVSLELVWIAAGGIAIGLAAGWVFAHLRRIVTDPSLDVALSVLTPFVAYVPAEKLHVSGVLATVVAGLYVGSRSLDIIEPGTRLRTLAFWDSTAFLLDGLLFVLIGAPGARRSSSASRTSDLTTLRRLRAADHGGGDGRADAVDARGAGGVPRRHDDPGAGRDRLERHARRRLARRRAGDHRPRASRSATSSSSSPTP